MLLREDKVEKEREGRVKNEDVKLSDENANVMDSDVNTLCDY